MKHVVYLMIFMFGVGGCARVPTPIGYDYSKQHKMQASHHWDILAADTAAEINKALILSDYVNAPVFVRETCGDENTPCKPFETSVFDETFRDLLVTHLVALGVPTSAEPNEETIEVKYKAQTVFHNARRWRTIQPGLITTLTAGVIVLRNAPWEIGAIAGAAALDTANATYVRKSQFEVVLTTSMVVKSTYLYRNTNIYYINDADSWHYHTQAEPSKITLTTESRRPAAEPLLTGSAARPSAYQESDSDTAANDNKGI
jgi:hypothetical protein